MGDYVWIGDNVTLYSVAEISIGSHSVISQEAYLCAGTHDYRDVTFPFVSAPIRLQVSAGLLRGFLSDRASKSDMRP